MNFHFEFVENNSEPMENIKISGVQTLCENFQLGGSIWRFTEYASLRKIQQKICKKCSKVSFWKKKQSSRIILVWESFWAKQSVLAQLHPSKGSPINWKTIKENKCWI